MLPVAVGFGHTEPGWPLALVRGRGRTAVALAEDAPERVRLSIVPALTHDRRSPAEIGDHDRLRLTHRGRLVAAAGTAAVGLVVVAAAWSGASGEAAGPGSVPAPARVVVSDGDTLWSIARLVAPARDPRDEVSDLRRLNRLPDVSLTPGQVLRTR